MDVLFFLQIRTKFIRDFYRETSFPFTERKRKIEAGEDPFQLPYSEGGDPPFLEEWQEAEEAIDVLGQMCISLLSSCLQLYLKESINELHRSYSSEFLAKTGIGRPEDNKATFKKGWINGYRIFFRNRLRIDWARAPSNLNLLEEIVLTRNKAQHPETIRTLGIQQSHHDRAKYRRSFFADELEMKLFDGNDDYPSGEWVLPRYLNITGEKLLTAADEVDSFCGWLENELLNWPSQLKETTW
ncbi:MAG: hypothetical protein WD688_24115 [Candidatus Binatia bacterium]